MAENVKRKAKPAAGKRVRRVGPARKPGNAPDKAKAAAGRATQPAPKNDAQGQSPATGLPLFYGAATPLNVKEHGDLRLIPSDNAEFARSASAVVLTAAEFPQAATHYPIVFGGNGANPQAYAVTGHTNGKNAFVTEDGTWRANTYVPAYVRRYPFVLIEDREREVLSLGVDPSSDRLSRSDGKPLYEGGKASKTAEQALNFCLVFNREAERSRKLFAQIAKAGVLASQNVEVTLPDKRKSRITGFLIVDERKLNELDDETFLALRRSGALAMIYCQLWSMRGWKNLLAG